MSATLDNPEISQYLSGQGKAIPLFKVYMPEDAIEAANEVLRSGYIGQGPQVEKFEEELKLWVSNSYVLSLNSGTSAIHLALRLSGVQPDDEVITTPMTCMATNVPILAHGARIVWADIDPETGNLCPQSVKEKITSKTKAIICVDWGGYPCDLNELQAIAEENGIRLIEDAAHAFGAQYKGKYIGGIADFTCFSFQAIKHLTTVDGGALVCKDPEFYRKGKLLRWYGVDREGPKTDFRCEEDVVEYGYKFHMNDVAASMGRAQLKHIEGILKAHRTHAKEFQLAFAHLKGVNLLKHKQDRLGSYWLFTMKVTDRDAFMNKMLEKGITISQVHARNDFHTVFKEFKTSLPGVDAFTREQVSIPVGWWLTSKQTQYIIESIVTYFKI